MNTQSKADAILTPQRSGEEEASLSMADKIRQKFGWKVSVPQLFESVEII